MLDMDVVGVPCGGGPPLLEATACCHGGIMGLEEVGGAGGTMGGGCDTMLTGGGWDIRLGGLA